jgi:multiple sugar transport system substrate-binding protein
LPTDHQAALTRRQLLRLGGLGAAAAGILAACSSPAAAPAPTSAPAAAPTTAPAPTTAAAAKPTTAPAGAPTTGAAAAPTAAPTTAAAVSKNLGGDLNILQWNHFVPAYDTWFDKMAADWGQKNHVNVTVDHIANLDLPARLAAESAAKTGHDIIQFQAQVQTYRYENQLADVSDLVNFATEKYGQPTGLAKSTSFINNVWRAVPDFYIIIAPLVRDDLMATIGNPDLKTWDDVRQACSKLKDQSNNPAGLAISHCNDANHNWRSIMWAYGASEVKEDGKTLNVDTKEFRDFLDFAKAFHNDANTPEVFAWDDTSDNRFLGSGQASFIHDAISSLRSIQPPPDKPDPAAQKLFDSISIRPMLAGTGSSVDMPDVTLYAMWQFAKNQDAAKAFLHDYLDNWPEAMKQSTGYNMPFFENLFQKPMPVIGDDPKFQILQDWKGDQNLHTFGWPGPPNAAAQEVLANFHIPDIVGIYVRGNTSLDDTVKEATNRLKPIYDKYK